MDRLNDSYFEDIEFESEEEKNKIGVSTPLFYNILEIRAWFSQSTVYSGFPTNQDHVRLLVLQKE